MMEMEPWPELRRIAQEKGYSGAGEPGGFDLRELVKKWEPYIRFLLERMAGVYWGPAVAINFDVLSRSENGHAQVLWVVRCGSEFFPVMLDCLVENGLPVVRFVAFSQTNYWVCEPTLSTLMGGLERTFGEGPIRIKVIEDLFRRASV